MVTNAVLRGSAPSHVILYMFVVFTKWDGWRNFCVPLQLYGDFVQQLIDLYNSMTADDLRSTIDRTTDSPGACAAPTLLEVLERVLTLTGSNQKVDVCMRTLTVQLLCSNGELGYAMEARELSRRLVDRKLILGRCAYNVLFDHLDTSNPQCLTEAFLIISAMTTEWKILEKDKWYHDKRVQHQVIDGNNNNNRVDFQHLFEIIAPSALTYNKYLGVIESVVRRGTFASSSQVTSMLLDLINRFQMSNLVVPNKNCLVRVGHLSLLMKDDKTLHRVLSALRSMATLSTRYVQCSMCCPLVDRSVVFVSVVLRLLTILAVSVVKDSQCHREMLTAFITRGNFPSKI